MPKIKRTKKVRYVVQLPPTPCTQEMRDQIVEEAERLGVSIAEIQRAAYQFFLSTSDRKSINHREILDRKLQENPA